MFSLLGIPMFELFDGGFDALDLFGGEMRIINEQLQNTSSLEEGKNIVENFLLKKISGLKQSLPFEDAIHITSPQLSWTKIAYEAGYYDQKHMIRDFKIFAGVNPSVNEQQIYLLH